MLFVVGKLQRRVVDCLRRHKQELYNSVVPVCSPANTHVFTRCMRMHTCPPGMQSCLGSLNLVSLTPEHTHKRTCHADRQMSGTQSNFQSIPKRWDILEHGGPSTKWSIVPRNTWQICTIASHECCTPLASQNSPARICIVCLSSTHSTS